MCSASEVNVREVLGNSGRGCDQAIQNRGLLWVVDTLLLANLSSIRDTAALPVGP